MIHATVSLSLIVILRHPVSRHISTRIHRPSHSEDQAPTGSTGVADPSPVSTVMMLVMIFTLSSEETVIPP